MSLLEFSQPCTTGKPTYAECPDICRVHNLEHSAKLLFAECQKTCTRRTNGTRRPISLPSASHMALGKDTLCRVLVSWHSAKSVTCTDRRPANDRYGGDAFVCRVPTWGHSATRSLPSTHMGTLGNKIFAECPTVDTRQTLSRAPHPPAPQGRYAVTTNVPIFPRPLPLCFAECQIGALGKHIVMPSVMEQALGIY